MVTQAPADRTGIDGYQLRLPTFEGPLDVLLRLIERSQLAITEVSLVAVTEQFLAYLSDLRDVPPATVAEFSTVGSRLVLLKSRSLLPRPATADDEEAPDDLVQQLVDYRVIKEAAQRLAGRDAGGAAFARGGGAVVAPVASAPPRLARHEPAALVRALRRRLSVIPSPKEALPLRRVVSLREMVERMLTLLPPRGPARFSRVVATCEDRHEVLTAFLALLVLVRRRVVDAEQPDLFGEIAFQWSATELEARRHPAMTRAADD